MAWRKLDNWTAFADGYTIWVNGPLGLQQRQNAERFDWERAARVESTSVVVFRPAGIKGADQQGRCWTASLASGQAGAWRCMVDNSIHDPCFAIPGESGSVICGASPTGDPCGFRLKLTEPLPQRTVPATDRPWMLELADGVVCGFMTGATGGYQGERFNYGCTDRWYLLGDPQPGQVWTARQVLPSRDRSTLDGDVRVQIATVWK